MFSSTQEGITSALLETNFKSLHKDTETFEPRPRPSISASLCPRQIAFRMSVDTHETDRPKSLPYYAAIGNALEYVALEQYREKQQLIISQWKIPEELTKLGLDMGGVIDAIIEVDEKIIMIDIKTVGTVEAAPFLMLNHEDMQSLTKGSSIEIHASDSRIKETAIKGSKDSHLSQMQLYAAITGIPDVYLQIMSRKVQDRFNVHDSSPTVKFERVPTEATQLEKRVAVALYGIRCKELGLIPDVLLGIKKSQCSDAFCNFQNYCWQGNSNNLEVNLQPISPEKSKELKMEAYALAKEYVALSEERLEITMRLLQKEHNRRMRVGELL